MTEMLISLYRNSDSAGFSRVRKMARRAAAVPLVADADTPFDVIAERVGFAEARAFRRAFRRWLGVSPSELRAARNGLGSPRGSGPYA